MKNVHTTCPYCGVGCGMYLLKDGDKVRGVTPSRNHPVNRGKLCPKGWKAYEFIDHPDRLQTPLIKENGTFREASWEEALNLSARKFSAIKSKYGSESLAAISSARCTNEENYLVQKFARAVLGTNSVDHCART